MGSTPATRVAAALAAVTLAAAMLAATACERRGDTAQPTPSQGQACAPAGAHADDCEVPGYADRPWSVYVPSGYDASEPMPVVLFLHGGGGNAVNAQATTCPDGDLNSDGCLWAVGEAEGFITVFATGYGARPGAQLHTWNAGGGGDYACVSGAACADGSDDIAYLQALLDAVEADYAVDASRVYVMGFSNGAAMAHRVGCEMPERVAAVVALSGANALASNATCAPSVPVAVLHVHGTEDPCWSYETSLAFCADAQPQPKIGVAESTQAWVAALHCEGEASFGWMEDADPNDGTTATFAAYGGCDGGVEVRVITVEGMGHVYPDGFKVRDGAQDRDTITHDFGSAELWEWMRQWSRG